MSGQSKERVASNSGPVTLDRSLKFPSTREISLIDELLSAVGDYGEVRLTVKDGRLGFVAHIKSYDALKWHRVEVE